MKIPLQLSPTKNCNFLQRSSETTNPDKYTEKKPISDNLTGKSRWECVPVILSTAEPPLTATSLQLPRFLAYSPYISLLHSRF